MARKPQFDLPESAITRITENVRSMTDDRVERGIDLSKAMECDSCASNKSAAGSSLYGAYKLCNDCLLEFTLALASGRVDTVVDFMTQRIDGPDGPSGLDDGMNRQVSSRPSVAPRDKLMPSNEPA